MAAELRDIDDYITRELQIREIQDESNALNGLQLNATGGARDSVIRRIALAVDAAEYTIDQAISGGADLLLVHHGLFWGGHRRLDGAYGRKIRKCFEAGLSVFSVHLPLDLHPELGNNAGIATALEFEITAPFGSYRGLNIGLELSCDITAAELQEKCGAAIGPVRFYGKGPDRIRRLAVVSGGGGSCLREAAARGMDALLTGETAHYTALDAEEAGLHLILGGHYRTEVFGVKALGKRLAEVFALEAFFIEHDTGL